ncbi:hypothetical protein [Erwinia sp.]|uniref:hypothetical protein n=1 Tax=Erwinia citreus TaxID=558 RepID=UPI00289C8017|nr:hypothetical protein [Erwinia sp.]
MYWHKDAVTQGKERWAWHGVNALTPPPPQIMLNWTAVKISAGCNSKAPTTGCWLAA